MWCDLGQKLTRLIAIAKVKVKKRKKTGFRIFKSKRRISWMWQGLEEPSKDQVWTQEIEIALASKLNE